MAQKFAIIGWVWFAGSLSATYLILQFKVMLQSQLLCMAGLVFAPLLTILWLYRKYRFMLVIPIFYFITWEFS